MHHVWELPYPKTDSFGNEPLDLWLALNNVCQLPVRSFLHRKAQNIAWSTIIGISLKV